MRALGRSAYLVTLICLIAAGAPAQDSSTLDTTVLSFNIRYGRADDGPDSWPHRRDLVCATVKAHAPAILGVQECLAEQAAVLRDCLPGYDFTGTGRDDGAEAGEMCAIFTDRARYTVLADGTFWLSETPDVVGSRGWDAALHRIATWVQLVDRAAEPETLFVFNAHFDHIGPESRRHSAELLAQKVVAIAGAHPAIVMGDFNADEGSPPHAALTAHLADSWTAASREERRRGPGTFHGFDGRTERGRIDWVLHTPGLTCIDAGIDRRGFEGRYPSDHFPVWAVFRQDSRPE